MGGSFSHFPRRDPRGGRRAVPTASGHLQRTYPAAHGGQAPLPRRALLAAAAGASVGLAGCRGRAAAAGPAPTRAHTGLHLLIQLNWQGTGGNFQKSPAYALAAEFLQKRWADRQPGISSFTLILGDGSHMAVNLDSNATVAAVLAGQGPDLMETCCSGIPSLETSGLLLPLDPFIKQDNVDMSIFPAGVLSGLSTPAGLLGLPNAGQTEPLYVNLAVLDDLGLSYPDPGWTCTDAAALWRRVAGTANGQQRYGACLNYASTMMEWLVAGFGGSTYNPDRTVCALDRPEAVAAFQWLVPLLHEGAVVPRQQVGPVAGIQAGQVAFASACCGSLSSAVVAWGEKVKWSLLPMPAFPVRPANGIFHALYGINAESPAPPELLWSLLRFICIEPAWQLFWNAQLALAAPNQITPSLWEEWQAIVENTVPFTRGRHLEYFAQAARYGQGWAFARYAATQAASVEADAYSAMLQGRQTVPAALRQAAQQITEMEQAASAERATGSPASAFPSAGRPVAAVPAGI
jgi:ABC-type glycerol-3-phosphate transport system substrate-binding protein